jgi:hypothetical protein
MTTVTVHDEGDPAPAAAPPQPPAAAAPAPTPTEELVKAAIADTTLDCDDGRKIKVRKPGPLAQFRIVQAAGAESAANNTYMQMINPLIYVYEIDGQPVHLPMNPREIEALIARLGDDGLNAVMGWYLETIVIPGQKAIELAEQKARLKN